MDDALDHQDWVTFFKDHRVGYEGSGGSIVLSLKVDEILEGLPPVERAQSVTTNTAIAVLVALV